MNSRFRSHESRQPPSVVIGLLRIAVAVVVAMVLLHTASRTLGLGSGGLLQIGGGVKRGNMNGTKVIVPEEKMYFAMNYHDTSIWKPQSGPDGNGERTFADSLLAITLEWPVSMPELDRLPRADLDYSVARYRFEWLSIEVLDVSEAPRPPGAPDNGLARILQGKLDRLSREKLERWPVLVTDERRSHGSVKTTEVRYKIRSEDPKTGMAKAVPVGPYADQYRIWNQSLYWRGNENAAVQDLIVCDHGQLPNPSAVKQCWHSYLLPEWAAKVRVRYPRSWIPHWREIRKGTKRYVKSFEVPE